MKNKKDFDKFTKRNVHKRRSKEAAREELIRAAKETGVSINGAVFRDVYDSGKSGGMDSSGEDIVACGIFSGSKSSFGFVSLPGVGEDVFIPGGKSNGAIDGDYVEILYHKYINRDGEVKTEGRVTKIIEIGRRTVIGTLCEDIVRHGRRCFYKLYVQPDDSRISILPEVNDAAGASIGDKVEALIRRDGTPHPECDVIRTFGYTESKEANYEAVLAECEIVTDFTAEELSEAERISREEVSCEGREDLRKEKIFTIDGEGAKDLDDAVSIRKLPGGRYKLGVHIADVSHYVTERTPLDRCAMTRGTSVYFTDKVVPMLPTALSNGACSLNVGEDKYTISAFITIDSLGEIKDLRLCRSVIRSCVRGVYSEVNSLFDNSASSDIKKKYSQVLNSLERMKELYFILLNKSLSRGSVDFDSAEAIITLGNDGNPIGIEKRERGISERIIEQFMLAANEAVAGYLFNKAIPCVYRIHEAPPKENFQNFLNYLESQGFDVRHLRKGDPDAKTLSDILRTAEDRGLYEPVSYAMLRAMAKAKYSDERSPHFGLGMDTYCHFTSPIRRLSDLATHRIINRVIFEGKRPQLYASYARRAASAATDGELRAVNAERKIEDLYKVIYMSEREGEVFPAVISSIASFGIFCMLENTCEGLIPISELPGVFTFDERSLTMRSDYHTYRIAERVFVKLEEANIIRGKLRFSIVNQE